MTDENLHILLVEDDPTTRALVREILREETGLVVDEAADLTGAREALSNRRYDLVLLDLGLPDARGLASLAEVQMAAPAVPVVVLTGSDEDELARQAIAAGAQDYLVKGTHSRYLLTRSIRYAVERHRFAVESSRQFAALQESEERFRRFFEQAPYYCFMISPDATILDVNAEALDALGYRREELLGEPVCMLYAEDCHDRARELFARFHAEGRVEDEEMGVVGKTGQRRTVKLSATAVRDAEGRLLHSISIQRDVTERRALELQLAHTQKMECVGRLAGGVAHDFNNLLMTIGGFGELAQRELADDHPARADLEEVLTAAGQAADLTRQLQAFSQQQVCEPEDLDLDAVVGDLEKMLRRLLGEHIELVTEPAGDLSPVHMDLGQLQQVIINLAVNARDAMPAGGTLTIATHRADGGTLLSVADDGEGMDEAVRTHIFEPFFTTRQPGRGSGLGLSVIHGILTRSGADIACHSQPGSGTRFEIHFPPAPDHDASEARRRASGEALDGPVAILVVEDQEPIRRIIVRELERAGHRVTAVGDAEQALSHLTPTADPVQILLSDVILPGLNGVELARRAQRRQPDLRVLLMSGYLDETIPFAELQARGVPLLRKPFTQEALLARLTETLATAPVDLSTAGVDP